MKYSDFVLLSSFSCLKAYYQVLFYRASVFSSRLFPSGFKAANTFSYQSWYASTMYTVQCLKILGSITFPFLPFFGLANFYTILDKSFVNFLINLSDSIIS